MAARSDSTDERGRTAVEAVRWGGGVLVALLIIISTVAAGSAAAAPAIVEGPDVVVGVVEQCDTTAEEAVAAQNRSRALVRELQRLANETSVVDDEAVQSASYHLGRGEAHFRNSRYCAAIGKFRTAEDRARDELVRAYRVDARLLLNASAAQLADTGGADGDAAALRTRIEDTRSRVATADSLESARSAYRDARELHGAVAEESVPTRVWLARSLVLPTAGVVTVLMVLGAVFGAVARSTTGGRSEVVWNR